MDDRLQMLPPFQYWPRIAAYAYGQLLPAQPDLPACLLQWWFRRWTKSQLVSIRDRASSLF